MAAAYPETKEALDSILRRSGLTQEELARLTAVQPKTMERLARGNVKASEQLIRLFQMAAELHLERRRELQPKSELLQEGVNYIPKRRVPVVGFVAGADVLSDRAFNYSDLANQIEEDIETESKDPNALGLIVEGDSMDPEFQAGDRVIVAPNAEPRNKDIVVARTGEGAAMLKRLFRSGLEGKTIRLESTNPDYLPIVKEATEFRFIYPVIEMRRKLRR